MPFRTMNEVRQAGFLGFLTISQLRATNLEEVPREPGVYMVLRSVFDPPRFLSRSTGGFFKGKDPTVSIETLARKWVESAPVLYVGKAGGTNKTTGKKITSTLLSRLRAYLDFGAGKPIGHQGGRYIWQLENADNLIICWKATPHEEPVDVEQQLIDQSCAIFDGRYPFANCRR
jgi:hypothetical protein